MTRVFELGRAIYAATVRALGVQCVSDAGPSPAARLRSSIFHPGTMTAIAIPLLADVRAFFLDDYLHKIAQCLDALDEESVWWRANPQSNSIGNLILHLDGSTRMWVLGVAGGRPVERNRDAEFAERGPLAKSALLAKLRATLAEVDEVLGSLNDRVMLERRPSTKGEVTVLWAVLHAVEHFAMHTGQIILITKLRTSSGLRLSG